MSASYAQPVTAEDKIIAAYDIDAVELATRYDALSAEACWRPVIDLIPVHPGQLALDIGAGSGRDSAWLSTRGFEVVAIEPATGMRREGEARHNAPRWIDDRLPDLAVVHHLALSFDLILLNAVWMHVPDKMRARAFRKIVTLLKPGGLFFLTLRHGPSDADRTMFPVSEGEIQAFARDHGLTVVRVVQSEDPLGRSEVSWSFIALRLPDDGSIGLPLVRGIIINDGKSSTYKLGLLRSIAKVADDASALAEPLRGVDRVAIPFGLVALNWLRCYLPLVRAGLPQQPRNSGPDRLGFAGEGFRELLASDVTATDLRIGASFTGQRATAVMSALNEAKRTITAMPIRYTTMPNSQIQVFEAAGRTIRHKGPLTLTPEMLCSLGQIVMPGALWRTFQRMGTWIEPVLITEWARIIRIYAEDMGMPLECGFIEARLAWPELTRNTALAREAALRLQNPKDSLKCVWSNVELKTPAFDIDHAMPWSLWPCSDLWNLFPAARHVNQKEKRDLLPSAALLVEVRPAILSWWEQAWQHDSTLSRRFVNEATAALPLGGDTSLEAIFAGMEWRRLRISQDLQPPEWHGSNLTKAEPGQVIKDDCQTAR